MQQTTISANQQWRQHAACHMLGDYWFFAPPGEPREMKLRREQCAKRICSTCTVMTECRNYALTLGEVHGIWGGMTESERRELISGSAGIENFQQDEGNGYGTAGKRD
ncbi:WhiB family transcriptional regulator [Rhodococcus sp. 14C212]|uniref:WhiB family transcriptional regulator n=1 Tax=Rhodococcus sp. 14C212 TaxID=2711209 RepID=UPI0013EB9F18|nr:WhiB family transcriptional regulator [Rhodococcus sp. 14C212]NGP08330.1 WhiB family transcriptional regulator [Rhodococcus sp. 14C212]